MLQYRKAGLVGTAVVGEMDLAFVDMKNAFSLLLFSFLFFSF